jgi:hypothetical protein
MEPVEWEDCRSSESGAGGLWVSYDGYRALERNIIAMREYEAKLAALVAYYSGGQGVSDGH